MSYTCNPSVRRLGQEEGEFKASLGYTQKGLASKNREKGRNGGKERKEGRREAVGEGTGEGNRRKKEK